MKKSTKTGIIIFIVVILVTIFFSLSQFFFNDYEKSSANWESGIQQNFHGNGKYIAEIYIEGVIESENSSYNQKWLLSVIKKLKNDEKNSAIALFINSPGGGVYEADEIYLALQDYKKTGKPVYAYMGPIAASGGYYIACAANKIYANRNTLTGSIGVISGQSFDLTELLDNLGIKSETIHAGKNKNMGNYNEPLSEEQREILQEIADECYEQFTGIVASQRNIPLDEVKQLADGRVYTAKQALNLKLIDGIDTWDNVLSLFNEDYFIENPCHFKTFKYERKKSFFEMMLEGKTITGSSQYSALNSKLPSYICPVFN